MRRLSWLVLSGVLSGCTAPEPFPVEKPRSVGVPLEGPLHATLVGKINPQTLGTVRAFGTQFALDGNTLAVGNEEFYDGTHHGAVFIFERKLDDFEQVDVLGLVPRTSSLGGVVALDGPRLAAMELDGFIGNRVDVYERRGTRFQPDGKLVPSGQIPRGYAASVALSKDTIAAGSIVFAGEQGGGAVHVFVRGAAGNWSEQARLVPAGQPVPNFGQVVALENDLLAVGFRAESRDPSVWLFERSGGVWREQARFSAPDGSGQDRFGQALAISAGRLYVGAPGTRTVEFGLGGAVYEYSKIEGQWAESMIANTTGSENGEFGATLAADWPRLLVGAFAQNVSGGAYVFTAENGEWDPSPARIDNPEPTSNDEFGRGLALQGGTAVIGSPYNDTNGRDRGTAYAYAIGLQPGSACTASADCAGWCVNGICCNRRCDGACETCQGSSGLTVDGECAPYPFYTEVAGCLPMLCAGVGTCPTDCRGAGCARAHFCDQTSGQCLARGGPGAACRENTECLSETCDDGVCCDRGCDTCFSCRAPLTGAPEGTCAPVLAGTDPHGVCDVDPGFPSSCGADGKCDGAGKCRPFAPPNTPCGPKPAQCSGDTISGDLCNGLGGCGEGRATCAPNECRDGFCTETCREDRDCADNAFCSAAKSCVPKRANASPCERDLECATGYCTDGVCCNARCQGQCEWCHDTDTVGTCTIAKVGDPPPGRPPCSFGGNTNACAMAKCDGNDRDECKAVVTECGAYGCEDGRCKRSCTRGTSSVDCAPGAICNAEGRCVEIQSCDSATCSPYACDETGSCVKRCTSSLECAGGHSCTSKGECVKRVESPPFGCACQVVTPRTGPLAWPLAALFARSLRRRRRSASR